LGKLPVHISIGFHAPGKWVYDFFFVFLGIVQ
jgi:hypothetical protein